MRALLIAVAAALVGACVHPAAPQAQTETSMSDLGGAEWRRIDDEDANPHPPTITFEDGRASGYAGCNRWFASVTRAGDALRFGQAGATRMACAESSMAAERRFLAVINSTRSARIVGEELIFTDDAGAVLARFSR